MLVLLLVLVGSVAALTLARRLARHPLIRWLIDFAVSAYLIGKVLYRLGRTAFRFVSGEVRSWTLSRS